jgi:hypothetical protein
VPQELESPRTPDDLYLARGDDVCDARPVLTGDVLDDVEVTEPDGSRARLSVILVEHPCSLRSDGVNLVPKLLVAAVRPREGIGSWRGNFSLMFLPGLRPQEHAAADFGDPYVVSPGQLETGHRVACLSTFGINLMLQRQVHRTSRVVVPTLQFQAANEGVYEEADLIEEWCLDRGDQGVDPLEATSECVEWLRVTVNGVRRQDLLRDPQQRSTVRKEMRAHLRKQP